MIISVFSLIHLSVKSGSGAYIDLTSDYRLYADSSGSLIEINYAIHDTMVCYGKGVISKFCRSGNQFLYLG